ncbi:GDP-fucose protein O-fucosyltransferase 1-like [Ornithodoros turicata]
MAGRVAGVAPKSNMAASRLFVAFRFHSLFVLICESLLHWQLTGATHNGYVMYCPCMGRFGNQADHFLGALAFARGINRTLVLPPWVEYRTGEPKSVQVPFDTYFKVKPLQAYHDVITMEKFMKELAPSIWPPGKRTVFCYQKRGESESCNAKEGNPFGPFWDTFNIDFDASEFYGPLQYDIHYGDMAQLWNKRYPASEYPVLAFMGAPASFPVQEENLALHSHLMWSDMVLNRAKHFIRTVLPKGPFVGIHLRNGVDWSRACEHVEGSPLLFSAPQCAGYHGEKGSINAEVCFPSKDTVLKQIRRVVRALKARAVFVASDNNHMITDITEALKLHKVQAYKYESSNPHVDLAILGLANHFVGNCVSSFSAFAKRERDVNGLSSSFWAFSPAQGGTQAGHDEL